MTLTPSINNLIIDTISKIHQPIVTIARSKNQEDPKFHKFLDFPEGDSTFYDFPEAQEGGSRPLEPPKTNPPCTNIPSPRLKFNFRANMEANQPWLTVDVIAIPSAQHPFLKHPENILPKFDPDNDVSPEDHIKQFMLSLRLMDWSMKVLFSGYSPLLLLEKHQYGSLVSVRGQLHLENNLK
jgi:hypothetical protein